MDQLADGSATASEPALAGLSEAEARARRARGLSNKWSPPSSRSYAQIFRENVFTFINICLFLLGVALVLLGRPYDAVVSTGVITLNIVVSVVQEVRAKVTLDRIALLTRPTATVIRDGTEQVIALDRVVVGDTLKVGAGDQLVVDGQVIGGGVALDESLLTGEADQIAKHPGDLVYAGTFCVAGTGYFVAERVGAASLANQMTAKGKAFRRVLTPLQGEINLVIRIALLIVLYFEFLLILISLLHQVNLAESVENSTIIAGLIPNGLFLSIAVAYALGAVRILRFGALVQQSNAIESLSHVDTLCMDKTGTLTTNRLRVSGVHPLALPEDALTPVLGAIAASASAQNATSAALAAAWPGPRHRVVGEVAFSAARKWSAVAFDDGPEAQPRLRGVYALGAPEMLHPYLGSPPESAGDPWTEIAAAVHAFAERGLRVLLAAQAPDPAARLDDGDASDLPAGMTPLGLVALSDELRPELLTTLDAFARAGVRLKIISGDHPDTVLALARQAGMAADVGVTSGPELEQMSEQDFDATAETATIFGRITPEQKERLVRALRGRGHYVAMIGDGVNDVLSLKQAQLGIAMQSGSQAARAVADIVLMRDSFAVLVPAVLEGQRILNGMQDILKLFLTRICTIGLIIVSGLALGVFPFELRQGSIVTLFSVGIPAVLLAVWARPGLIPPSALQRRLLHFIIPPVATSAVLGLVLLASAWVLQMQDAGTLKTRATLDVSGLPVAQTTLTAFLVLCGLLLVIFVQPPTKWWTGGNALSGDTRPTALAVALMLAFFAVTFVPQLRLLFALEPLGPREWLLLAAAVVLWVVLVRWTWRARLLERYLSVQPLERAANGSGRNG